MARKFLTALDMAKNEIQNGVAQNLASAPSAPVKGQFYFNSTDNVWYWWDGTVWVASKASATSFGAVAAEPTFGTAPADGVASTVARSDHKHGNPLHDNAAHAAVSRSALAAPTGDISMAGFKITSLGTPITGTDATTKDYVDNLSAGLSWKDAVRVASTANINVLVGGLVAVDGVTVVANDRVLTKNSSNPVYNGIWLAQSGAWTRATDADTGPELEQATVFVMEGTTQADTAWTMTTNAPITPGTTGLTWAQFGAGTAYSAGNGLTLTGSTFDVVGDASITVAADSISRAALTGDVTATAGANATAIANGVVTNAKLANMTGYTLKMNNTGSSAAPQDVSPVVLKPLLGYPGVYNTNSIGGATSQVVNHNLNSMAVIVNVYRFSAPFDTVECDVERTNANNVTLRFAVAPAANEYACVVVG